MPVEFTLERLGGPTNRNFKVSVADARYVLRIPGEKTSDYIDRKVEAHNARAAARAARALRQMHRSGRTFKFRFELFGMIYEYLKVLAKLGAQLPEGYHDTVREAGAVRKTLDGRPAALAPCHCDPLSENFLDNGKRMWVVDWEYSGMNDPLWDLGDMSVEAGLDEARDAEMMEAYCDGRPRLRSRAGWSSTRPCATSSGPSGA